MADIDKVKPETVRERMQKSDDTLLVCAYDDDSKCREKHLEGAITLSQLEKKQPAKDAELVFYCA